MTGLGYRPILLEMTTPPVDTTPTRWQFVEEVIRAVFVLAAVGLAALFVSLTGWAFVTASDPPPTPPGVDPRIGFDDAVTYGIAAMFACAGALWSVRLWLRGSWHVISLAVGTGILMLGFVIYLAVNNWSQH